MYNHGVIYPENALHEEVNIRTLDIPQRTRIFKANYSLIVHNVHFKLALSISG